MDADADAFLNSSSPLRATSPNVNTPAYYINPSGVDTTAFFNNSSPLYATSPNDSASSGMIFSSKSDSDPVVLPSRSTRANHESYNDSLTDDIVTDTNHNHKGNSVSHSITPLDDDNVTFLNNTTILRAISHNGNDLTLSFTPYDDDAVAFLNISSLLRVTFPNDSFPDFLILSSSLQSRPIR